MKYLLVIVGVFFIYQISFSQKINEFSESPASFIDEFETFMVESKNKNAKDAFEGFAAHWNGGSMGFEAQDAFIATSNILLKKNFRPTPDFASFLVAVSSFYNQSIDENTAVQFIESIGKLAEMKQGKPAIKSYCDFFVPFNKLKALTTSSGKTWLTNASSYEINTDKMPYLILEGIDLRLGGRGDTLEILGTSGKFYPMSQQWYGNGGDVSWARCGLNPGSVYATLKKYNIDMTKTEYSADSVVFYNSDVYSFPIDGKITDKIHQQGTNGPYPKFVSYKNRFDLTGLEDYLQYLGGFGMEGRKILGSGTANLPAKLIVKRNGKRFIKLESNSFIVDSGLIVSGQTAFTMYLENDSIVHPNLYLKINRSTGDILLSTSLSTLSNSPFYDSYHQIDIYADRVTYNIDSMFVEIDATRDPDGRANFESVNYFSVNRFNKVQGNMAYHPLLKLNQMSEIYSKRILFTELELISFFNVDKIETLQPLLAILNNQGYIVYDVKNKDVLFKEKFFNYINAYQKKIDFDVLTLNSVIKDKANSKLNLENYDLEIRGIKNLKLSDSQAVEFFPYQQTITMKKNRNIDFSGYLKAGRFEYFGRDFHFDYENFKIDLDQIDSMMFNFPDKKLNNRLRRVNTVVQNITGKLLIDKPNNKSGRLAAPNFPIFDCFKEAFVYYDYKRVYNKVYDRERFYFKLKPFVVDSLDNFSLFGLSLEGTFKSANIIPVFDYKLSLQKDFSLGFKTKTPDAGYPLYGGKGHCNMEIYLSNRGLQGNGDFTYNGAKIHSDMMTFFPDSMKSKNTIFKLEDHATLPFVSSEKADLEWSPYADTMKIAAIDSNSFINMYETESFLKGSLIFTKKNLFGEGKFNYKNSIVESNTFDFKKRKLSADSTAFTLFTQDKSKIVMANDDSYVKIDFDKQLLEGATNFDTVYTRLPLNQYATNIPTFKWNVQEKKLYLAKGEEMSEDDEFFFVSTNPAYDSLTFTPETAVLNLDSFEIEAFKIKYIAVADSRIKPAEAVIIGEDGKLPPLVDAEITASGENMYHLIKKANVNIFSSKSFSASGMYQYSDTSGRSQEIYMPEIRTTDSGITIGVGEIPDTSNFYFSTNMLYTGLVNFNSMEKAISFDGTITVEHPNSFELGTEKVKYIGKAATDSLYLDVNDQKNVLGQELHTGVYLNTKTNRLYSLFLGRKLSPEDWPVFEAQGLLYYTPDSNMFVISEIDRIFDKDLRGSQWLYNLNDKTIKSDGPIGFDYNYDNFKLLLSGLINYEIETEKFEMYMTGGIDFPIDISAAKVMADSLLNLAYFNQDVVNSEPYIMSGAIRYVEKSKDREKSINSIINTEMIPTYKEYEPLIQFSGIKFDWDTSQLAFVNLEPISLANIKAIPINKQINGRFDFVKKTAFDSISIYFETNPGNWYQFVFAENILYINSSDETFVTKVLDKKPKDLKGKYDIKETEAIQVEEVRAKIIRK